MSEKIKDPAMEILQKVMDEAAKTVIAHLPALQQFTTQVIDTVFVPKVIARQLALLIALEAGLFTAEQVTQIIQYIASNFSSRSRLIRQLMHEQELSATQDEWMDLAERIDNIQGHDIWRSDPACTLYEQDRIAARIDEYVHLMRRRDIFELMFVLRGGIGRNKFGLLHQDLFSKAIAGSKVLVETYHNVVCAALDFVCDAPVLPSEEPIPTDARLAFFNETRHAYGRTALLLSGGAALGFYHVGVVKALMENRLMPRVLGGSSAGSLVCGMIGTRTDEECVEDLFEVRGTNAPGHSGQLILNFFRPLGKAPDEPIVAKQRVHVGGLMEVYHNTAGAFHDAKRTFQGFMPIPIRQFTSFLYDLLTGNTRPQDIFKNDTEYFRKCVKASVGNFTFQEAFDRTGRITNIVVTPKNATDPPRLLNYLTAPHVLVWSAAVASSSLPGVFEANRLVVKEADGHERYESGGGMKAAFSDGSMEQDLPMQQLSEMFNINHFIVSQANPHAVMFASYNQKISVWTNPIVGYMKLVVVFLKDQVRSWLSHLVSVFGGHKLSPVSKQGRGIGSQFFTQEYEGRSCDISLIPWLGHRGLLSALLHIIYNPSEAEFREWIAAAERETWKYIPAIKSHIAEEITLDRCVQRLRKRIVQESWDKQNRASADNVESGQSKISSRVPSFFTSNSLVNLSGLGVSDQPAAETLHDYANVKVQPNIPPTATVVPAVSLNSGWGGMGLRGNRSSGNLQRTSSDASGLFIDEEEQSARQQQQPGEQTSMTITSVAENNNNDGLGDQQRSHSEGAFDNSAGYVKTTSMAQFYYKYRKRTGQDTNQLPPQKTSSESYLDDTNNNNNNDAAAAASATTNNNNMSGRKWLSHADLGSSTTEFVPLNDTKT